MHTIKYGKNYLVVNLKIKFSLCLKISISGMYKKIWA